MTVHAHSDSKSGDIKARLDKRSGHVNAVEGEQIEIAFNQREVDRRYRDLPAIQGSEGSNVNFLGSSFSGVDIKVIAHLYDVVPWKEKKLEELNYKKEVSKTIEDGCTALIQGGFAGLNRVEYDEPDYAERRTAFLRAAGVNPQTEAQQEAASILVNGIFKAGEGFTFIGIARMQRRADALREVHAAYVTEYDQRIEHISAREQANSSSTVNLGTLQTISVQSFREKNAVRALGHTYAKGYTRGTRTIGGSCIFTIFNEHALSRLIREMDSSSNYGERDAELSTLLADQLPPLDLTIVFANEYGALSDFRLYGVEFFTDGSVFSIEDLLSEETMNFVCRDADVMTSRGRISISRLQRGMFNDKDDKDINGSSLLFDNQAYYEYLQRLGVRRRLTNR